MADILVFALPVLFLCVPRGAGVFMAGVVLLGLAGWRQMSGAWRAYLPELRPLSLAVLAFIAVYVFSKLYHHTPWNVVDNPSRALLAVLTCWVIVRTAPNPAMLWRGITVALVGALLIVGYQKFVLMYERPSAWVQAIAFANMVSALGLVGFARPGENRRAHGEAWLNVICSVLILIMNGTRGAAVAMLVTLLPLLLVRYRGFSMRMFLISVTAIATLLAALYLMHGSPIAQRVGLAVTEVQQFQQGNTESSVGARLMLWHVGMRYFAEHPWTGAGVGQFAQVLHAAPYCIEHTGSGACGLEHAHNDIVEAASTTGIPGLGALLGLFLVPAALLWRALRACRASGNDRGMSVSAAGLAVVMGSMISGLTQVTLAHQANIVFYAGLVGLLLGMSVREAWAPGERRSLGEPARAEPPRKKVLRARRNA